MKSIKEKAKEHGLEYPGIRYSHDDIYKDCDKPSMDFEAGANYVLSVLYDAAYKDDWITNPKDGIRRFFEIYKQLKK